MICTCQGYYENREGWVVIATQPGCPEHDPEHKRPTYGEPCTAEGTPLTPCLL